MANAIGKNSDVITAEHAVLIPPVSGATSIMAYVEAVATVIGSCHIHSVYEDQEYIKVYLNDKKFVDFLVNTGISVLGRKVDVEYAIPRADKVILKNIDPIIPDSILLRFLCYYGTPVSTVIHEKIASNLEYSHIECGTRKIYMNIFKDKKPPTKVSIQYQDVSYRFDMAVECYDKAVMEIDSSNSEEVIDEDTDEMQDAESVETVKPNINEINEGIKRSRTRSMKPPTPKQVAYRKRGRSKKNLENSVTYAARKIKSRAAKGWYKNKVTKAKNMASNRGLAKVITARGGKKGKRGGFTKGSRGGKATTPKTSLSSSTPMQVNDLTNGAESAEEDVRLIDQVSPVFNKIPAERRNSRAISQFPLTTEELKKLMFQTRCNRAPLQVAQEFLERKNAPNALEELLSQLMEYHNVVKVQSLRIRIRRLVKTLQSSSIEKSA